MAGDFMKNYKHKVYRKKGKRPSFPRGRENPLNPSARYNIAFAPYGKRYSKKKSSTHFTLSRITDKYPHLPF